MENASKALLIAGGFLLTMLVLTLFVVIFQQVADQTRSIYANMEEAEIAEFNQKFLNYDGRNNLTPQDIVTIVNLAKYNNNEGKMPVHVSVKVIMQPGNEQTGWENKTTEELNFFLGQHSDDKYSCTVKYADATIYEGKLVGNVTITKNNP